MKKKKKFAKICKKERLSNRQSDRSRESLFLRYTDGAINSEQSVSWTSPCFVFMVQSVKENCDAVRDNAGQNENFKRDEVKTEANTDKRGKRPFDSCRMQHVSRATCLKVVARPIPDFVWSPPLLLCCPSRPPSPPTLCLALA